MPGISMRGQGGKALTPRLLLLASGTGWALVRHWFAKHGYPAHMRGAGVWIMGVPARNMGVRVRARRPCSMCMPWAYCQHAAQASSVRCTGGQPCPMTRYGAVSRADSFTLSNPQALPDPHPHTNTPHTGTTHYTGHTNLNLITTVP